ncbi:MAG: hypothetical protein CVU38_01830 [Chloroflexi bacterium HGW-Chloroflexi-1]|nr:MAG: hypothetical protein CVU38_01830 [Chloroflexi bacterium HGW-Chloroflexi-1]
MVAIQLKAPVGDFEKHNEEVQRVWEAYHKRQPIRVPMIIGTNVRYTMWRKDVNARGITFQQCFTDPQLMLERELEHQFFERHYIPQDAEMGLPKDGWSVEVGFQNVYEAAWLGCEVRFYPNQVPDVAPLLKDESRKRMLFDAGIPDPFTGGLMKRNWEFYAHMQRMPESGYTFHGKPIASVMPCGLGTDGPVSVACNVRGATEFMTDLAVDTDYALELLDFITTAIIERIRAYRKRLGMASKPQEWGFADDSIQLISNEMYRELVFPFHKRLVDELSGGGPISMHLCGNVSHHLKYLHEKLNVRSFDTGFPIDLGMMRRILGNDVELIGGPTVTFLGRATSEQVRAEVRRILQSGVMDGGRFTLREANNLPPDVPLENVWAMYDAVREYGCYR